MRNNPSALFFPLILLFGFPANIFAQGKTEAVTPYYNYSIESATHFIDMIKKMQGNTFPQEEEWQKLFATEGYANFFSACENPLSWQQNIRTAFRFVFDKTQQVKQDSILSIPYVFSDVFVQHIEKECRELE